MKKQISTKWGLLIIIAFAVVFAGGALDLFYLNQPSYEFNDLLPSKNKSKTSIEAPSTTFPESTLPTESVLPTSWKTYSSDSISIEYPFDWEYAIKNQAIQFYPTGKRPSIEGELTGDIILNVYDNPKKLSLVEFYDGKNNANLYKDAMDGYEDISVDSTSAIKFKGVGGLLVYTIVAVPKNDIIFELLDNGQAHQKDGIFDHMVSSIKFK